MSEPNEPENELFTDQIADPVLLASLSAIAKRHGLSYTDPRDFVTDEVAERIEADLTARIERETGLYAGDDPDAR